MIDILPTFSPSIEDLDKSANSTYQIRAKHVRPRMLYALVKLLCTARTSLLFFFELVALESPLKILRIRR